LIVLRVSRRGSVGVEDRLAREIVTVASGLGVDDSEPREFCATATQRRVTDPVAGA
jgi:hypothetical protein